MGAKNSTRKCPSSTIKYIRTKDVDKLTRQLSKRTASKRMKKSKRVDENNENDADLLRLDLNKDEKQRSVLHIASIEGDSAIIMALFEYMHTVDVVDSSGRTPLHYAAIVGNEETLSTLLLCNPDLNRTSHFGTTPLHEAIINNHPRLMTLLLQNNADVNILYKEYLPPLILAVYLQHTIIVDLLIQLGVDPNLKEKHMHRTALHYAAYFHEDTKIFHLLLSSTIHHIIDINAQDQNGYSVLDYARANIHGNTSIVDLLLQLHAYDPDRGETIQTNVQIDVPEIKIYHTPNELASINPIGKINERNTEKIQHLTRQK